MPNDHHPYPSTRNKTIHPFRETKYTPIRNLDGSFEVLIWQYEKEVMVCWDNIVVQMLVPLDRWVDMYNIVEWNAILLLVSDNNKNNDHMEEDHDWRWLVVVVLVLDKQWSNENLARVRPQRDEFARPDWNNVVVEY